MEDRRKTRSCEYLTSALVRLMKKKSIQFITVQNLVDEAQLARSTFYSLYENKQQFVNQVIDNMFYNLRMETKMDTFIGHSFTNEQDLYKYYLKHFEYIAKHADFFSVMLGNNGVSSFRKKMEDSALKTYEEIFNDIELNNLVVSKDYLIQYVISAHMGITFKWLRDGMKYSPNYMAEIVNNLTFKGIFLSFGLSIEEYKSKK